MDQKFAWELLNSCCVDTGEEAYEGNRTSHPDDLKGAEDISSQIPLFQQHWRIFVLTIWPVGVKNKHL